MKDDEKQERLAAGDAYTLVDHFVYPPHSHLPTYCLKYKEKEYTVGHYMIDFRKAYRIECDAIIDTNKVASSADLARRHEQAMSAKLLQLTREARAELRDKLADYYGRIPDEDKD